MSDAYATGQALFTLHELGVPAKDASYRHGVQYLLQTQAEDGKLVGEEPGGEDPAVLQYQLPVLRRSVDFGFRHRLGGHGAELRQRSAASGAAVA